MTGLRVHSAQWQTISNFAGLPKCHFQAHCNFFSSRAIVYPYYLIVRLGTNSSVCHTVYISIYPMSYIYMCMCIISIKTTQCLTQNQSCFNHLHRYSFNRPHFHTFKEQGVKRQMKYKLEKTTVDPELESVGFSAGWSAGGQPP